MGAPRCPRSLRLGPLLRAGISQDARARLHLLDEPLPALEHVARQVEVTGRERDDVDLHAELSGAGGHRRAILRVAHVDERRDDVAHARQALVQRGDGVEHRAARRQFVVDEDERHDAPSRTPREEAVVRRQDEVAGGVRVLLLEGADGREPGDGASRRMDRRRPQRIRDALAERRRRLGEPHDDACR